MNNRTTFIGLVVLITGFAIGVFGAQATKYGGFSNAFSNAQPFTIVAPSSTAGLPSNAATTTRFFGSISPQVTDAYSLGESAYSWRNIYASGTLFGVTVSSTNLTWVNATGTYLAITNINSNLIPLTNNTRDIGSGALSWRDIYASGTSRLSSIVSTNSTSTYFAVTNVNSALTPLANNTYDIGSGALSWKDIYASGTLYVPTASPTNLTWTNATGTNTTSTNLAVTNVAQMGTASATTMIAGLGLVGTPAFTFSGDTDTGLFSLSSNSMSVSIAGTERFRFGSPNLSNASLSPVSHNAFDLGSFTNGWRDVYVSGTARLNAIAVGGGTQASPAINFDGSTNSGFYSPAAQDVRIERAGTTDMAIFNANGIQFADHTFPGSNDLYNLGKFGSAWKGIYASSTSYFTGVNSAGGIVPSITNTYDLGASGNQWSRTYTGDVLLQGAIVLNGALITGASTTRALESGFTTPTDGSFVAREFILSGVTADALAQTLSIIESPTSTLKITNASTNNGLGMLMSGTSTFQGVVDVIRAPGMTTSTLRVGSATLRGCLAIGDDDGAGVTWCTTLNGVLTCSNTLSCE